MLGSIGRAWAIDKSEETLFTTGNSMRGVTTNHIGKVMVAEMIGAGIRDAKVAFLLTHVPPWHCGG